MTMEKRKMKPEQALMRLESLCARSEQSTWELRQKLMRWGIDDAVSGKIMVQLEKTKFVDDCRFAHAYCRDKFRFSRWGKVKITNGLIQKRISKEYINDALMEIDEQEYEQTLLELLKQKAKTIEDVCSYDGKTRLFRFGVSRGFEPSMVVKLINGGRIWVSED